MATVATKRNKAKKGKRGKSGQKGKTSKIEVILQNTPILLRSLGGGREKSLEEGRGKRGKLPLVATCCVSIN